MRRDRELALAALLHAGDAVVPALDDASLAEVEREGLGAVFLRGVELLTVLERADVVDLHRVAGLRLGALANDEVLDLELRIRIRRRAAQGSRSGVGAAWEPRSALRLCLRGRRGVFSCMGSGFGGSVSFEQPVIASSRR